MIIKKAEFVVSAVSASQYPIGDRPDIAFAGRSNVGKSSLINRMLNRKKLAKTSSDPGKTRTINFYNVNDLLYFVDLPGYGYAKVSESERRKWGGMIEGYLNGRTSLADVVLLVDIRHQPTQDDRLMYSWIKSRNLNATVIGTKCDKISKSQYAKHASAVKSVLGMNGSDRLILFSAESGFGADELWSLFDGMLETAGTKGSSLF